MSRFKLEGIFVLAITAVAVLLFFVAPMDKLAYMGIETNLLFSIMLYVMIGFMIAFNYYVLDYAFWLNLVTVILIVVLSRFMAHIVVQLVVFRLEQADQQQTPLGWQFKYKWLELGAAGLFMVIWTEVGYIITNKFNRA